MWLNSTSRARLQHLNLIGSNQNVSSPGEILKNNQTQSLLGRNCNVGDGKFMETGQEVVTN